MQAGCNTPPGAESTPHSEGGRGLRVGEQLFLRSAAGKLHHPRGNEVGLESLEGNYGFDGAGELAGVSGS